MAIQVASFLIPKNLNTFYVLEDKYIKGGLHVVNDIAERDGINPLNKKAGMIVICKDDKKLYQLQDDLTTYLEVEVGGGGGLGVRQTVSYTTQSLDLLEAEMFDLALGKAAMVYRLEVNRPTLVEAYGLSDYSDTNPYKFVASTDHLNDDGSTVLLDGTRVNGRRYTVLANEDAIVSNLIHWKLTNLDQVAGAVVLNITFLPLEV